MFSGLNIHEGAGITTDENKRVIQRFIEEALNRKNLDVLDTTDAQKEVGMQRMLHRRPLLEWSN